MRIRKMVASSIIPAENIPLLMLMYSRSRNVTRARATKTMHTWDVDQCCNKLWVIEDGYLHFPCLEGEDEAHNLKYSQVEEDEQITVEGRWSRLITHPDIVLLTHSQCLYKVITTSHVTSPCYIATHTRSSWQIAYHSSFSVLIISQEHRRPHLGDSLPDRKRNCNAYDQHNNQNKVPVLWSLCKCSRACGYEMWIHLYFSGHHKKNICAALTEDVNNHKACTHILRP